jgi:hypothetical protein
MSELFDNVSSLDCDDDHFDDITVEKSCYCGYNGPLEPDARGYVCPDCGYLLVHKK